MITESVLNQLEFNKVLSYVSGACYTVKGKSIIEEARPFPSRETCLIEGNYVTIARDLLIDYDYPPFVSLPDLSADLARCKVENAVLPIESIQNFKDLAVCGRELYQYLKNREESKQLFTEIAAKIFIDKNFEHNISSIFTSKGEIADGASTKLREIRKAIIEKNSQLTRVVNTILKKLSDGALVQENYITLKEGRIVLPVKVEHKRQVRGFIHSESATGQTVFIEPEETLDLNNEILSLKFEEKREIERILKKLTKKIAEVSEELKISLNIIAHLDSIFAKAKYSIEVIGAFPEFNESRAFEIMDARHPILVKKLGKNKTVPLNLKIVDKNVVVITGPNAGGKTVVLKTVGLLALLVQSGFHVPVHPDSNFKFFETILVDIGDKQSIEDDLSTFSWHLTNIKNILDSSSNDTLVLLDEIGTGTDPAEGSAIALAILSKLYDYGAVVLASTHHGNLKVVANEHEGFENASMEFDTENLVPTYKFIQGVPGSSYAFEIAARIGYNEDFLDLAKNNLDVHQNKIEDFLVDLEKKTFEYREKLSSVEKENNRLTELTSSYETKIKQLEEQKKEILKETQAKAQTYLKDVNKKVEKVIKNIRESDADKNTIKQEKQFIRQLKDDVKKLVPEESLDSIVPQRELVVGDFVAIKDTSTTGVIIKIDKNKKVCVVEAGSIKLNMPLKNLNLAKKQKVKENQYYVKSNFTPSVESHRLDLRGMKPEEAEFEVVRFLDNAYSSGLGNVEILHGKGTGALKKVAQEVIKASDYVKKHYFAGVEFGGEGITVVELK